jgi:glycosyltransferase involved in cell wall biosynthesis
MIIPLVSVLMPVYNAERYLKESIESILNQTLTDFEFIIINDGSNDQSDKIISSYLDARIVYINNDVNNGVTYCLNQGLTLCKGKFVARMDADDISTIDRLNRQVSFFEENINLGVCGSNMRVFGEMDTELIYPETHFSILEKMFYENPIAHPTVMLRRSLLFENNLNYPAKYPAAEDYGLWMLLRKTTKFHNIQEFLVNYRYHTNQVRAIENKVQNDSIKKIQIKLVSNEFNYLGGFINKRLYNQIIFKNKRFSFFLKLILKTHIFLKYKF